MAYKKYESETERILAKKLSQLKGRCKNGRFKAVHKGKAVPFDLTTNWLFEQFNTQKGKCFFTNIEMQLETSGNGSPMWNSLSFDRFDSQKGYLQGNVVLSIHSVNLMRTWSLPRESDIKKLVNSIHKIHKQEIKLKHQVKKGNKIINP